MVDPEDFTSPVYEVWARNTANDNRSHGGYRDVNGEDPGEAFTKRQTTTDVVEARRLLLLWKAKPYTAAYVKVEWKRDESAYKTACDLAQLAHLKAQYPNG